MSMGFGDALALRRHIIFQCVRCSWPQKALRDAKRVLQDGSVAHLDHVFLRGSRIRFMIIPDMLKNAPMFKRIDPKHKVGTMDCAAEVAVVIALDHRPYVTVPWIVVMHTMRIAADPTKVNDLTASAGASVVAA